MRNPASMCLVLLMFAASIGDAPAAAPEASDWVETPYSGIRLIAGAMHGDTLEVGVQIRMKPGWKTYWKVPGDSGVPPFFDWSRSSNVASARILYPAPKRYVDQYATAIGYKDEVVFPVQLTQVSKAMPTIAKVTVAYAVCSDICLPASADLTLNLAKAPRATTTSSALIARYRKKVPATDAKESHPRIASARVTGSGKDARLMLEVDQKAGSPDVEIFVEGPPEFYFAEPRRQPQSGLDGTARYSMAVDGVTSSDTLNGRKLLFTVVGDQGALEQQLPVN